MALTKRRDVLRGSVHGRAVEATVLTNVQIFDGALVCIDIVNGGLVPCDSEVATQRFFGVAMRPLDASLTIPIPKDAQVAVARRGNFWLPSLENNTNYGGVLMYAIDDETVSRDPGTHPLLVGQCVRGTATPQEVYVDLQRRTID